jgi:hypothetical protein
MTINNAHMTKISHEILIWDNDGTITGAKNPNDQSDKAKIILPNVKATMEKASYNFIISGFKSLESEAQDFDPEKVKDNFNKLMENLPINAAAFSPSIGGVACYVLIKKLDGNMAFKKAHEEARYEQFIGQFKKPGIGMFMVIKDIAWEEFGQRIEAGNTMMIGDTWHDEKAAQDFGIPFLAAENVHQEAFSCD